MPHPLVMFPTLFWGVLKGAKISLVIALWIGGLAQWWLARELGVGRLARLWSSLMVIVAGHLAGRMEMGVFGVFFSTASTSLIFGAIIQIHRKKGYRPVVLLATVIASSLLSGQGYMQIGMIFIMPVSLVFILNDSKLIQPTWRRYLLASILGILLASFFIVPLLHFMPNFAKDIDPNFNSAQSLQYVPLNLIINDPDFYRSVVLDKLPFPYLYTLFIGWIPVVLALIGIGMGKKIMRKRVIFLVLCTMMAFFTASAIPFEWLVNKIPMLAGIRQPSLIAGLAVPPILGLAAYGLDQIIRMDWPTLSINFSKTTSKPKFLFSLRWLLLIPLIFSLYQGYRFTRHWIYTDTLGDGVFLVVNKLETNTAQWINPPYAEHFFLSITADRNLKISPGIRPWHWKGRINPLPFMEAIRSNPPLEMEKIAVVDQVGIYTRPEEFYSFVVAGDNQEPCFANSTGGKITVICDNDLPGTLVVKENMWTGWKAWMDGERVPLIGTNWLEVETPGGNHTFQFRYRPWDVPLGLALSLGSILVCIHLWFNGSDHRNAKNFD
jgi:hypothetical protein